MIRNIEIRAVLNGFIVQVGCQTVVFDNIAQLQAALYSYLTDPEGTEKKWTKLAINAKYLFPMGEANVRATAQERLAGAEVGYGALGGALNAVPPPASGLPMSVQDNSIRSHEDPRFNPAQTTGRY